MSDEFKLEPAGEQPASSRSPGSLLKILVALAAVAVIVFFLYSRETPKRATAAHEPRLPFGAAEQAYARKLKVENVALSQAENFLHQEVTTVSCDLINGGDAPVQAVELTAEFFDELPQIVLRERRVVLDAKAPPLKPGESRNLEFSFEHIPYSWNRQQPALHVSGLELASHKE